MNQTKIKTDSLGFPLEVEISIGDFAQLGEHKTFANYDTGLVDASSPHKINIQEGWDASNIALAAAHECYHLFYSIRHLITADEETQAEVFGGLVKEIFQLSML